MNAHAKKFAKADREHEQRERARRQKEEAQRRKAARAGQPSETR